MSTATIAAPPAGHGVVEARRPRIIPQAIGLVLLVISEPESTRWSALGGLLDRCSRRGLPCLAICPAPRDRLKAWLTRHGCDDRLPMRICGPELTAPLPDSAVLRLAARRLCCKTAHCLVISDGPLGLEAAAAAGCPTIDLGRPDRPNGWIPTDVAILYRWLQTVSEDAASSA